MQIFWSLPDTTKTISFFISLRDQRSFYWNVKILITWTLRIAYCFTTTYSFHPKYLGMNTTSETILLDYPIQVSILNRHDGIMADNTKWIWCFKTIYFLWWSWFIRIYVKTEKWYVLYSRHCLHYSPERELIQSMPHKAYSMVCCIRACWAPQGKHCCLGSAAWWTCWHGTYFRWSRWIRGSSI